MKIDIQTKNYVVRDKLRALIEKKVERLGKFLGDNASSKVVCSANKDRYKMEVNIYADGRYIRSEVESDNMYTNVDLCISKIEKQIVKYGDKIKDLKRKALSELSFFDEIPEFKTAKIAKRKTYTLTPLTEDAAIEQMDLVGHDFFVFMNSETNSICVLYKRADGDYGIIETL